MIESHIEHLRCPDCRGMLLWQEAAVRAGTRILEGELACAPCRRRVPVRGGIPRFVSSDNYAQSFGFEWLRHARTQYDQQTGTTITERRFFAQTQWPRDLAGRRILEVGSGSGRFTAVAAATGGLVVSLDYSRAVEANYASNGARDNVLIVQGDIYRLPVAEGYFDYLFCLGVLQHTPDVEKAFKQLPRHLKAGGYLAMDVYAKMRGLLPFLLRSTSTHYRIRPLTRRMEPERLYRLCQGHIRRMWPLAKRLSRWPRAGGFLLRRLLVPPYVGVYDLPEEQLKDWMVLDLFDSLSPAYDQPQFLDVVERWFRECDLAEVAVGYGYNGVNGRGRKRSDGAPPMRAGI